VKLFARLLLVFAFVFAQAGGIAHELWHSTAPDVSVDGKAPKKNALCDFHTALGSVLGVLSNAHGALEADRHQSPPFAVAESRAAGFSLLASRSRSPPTLL
jgi:hypothetical protein